MKRIQITATYSMAVLCVLTTVVIATAFVRIGGASPQTGLSSEDGIWRYIDESSLSGSQKERTIVPRFYKTVQLNQDALMNLLLQAPMEFTGAAKTRQLVMTLPMPDGKFARFRIEESPIMEPGLAAQFPQIKTYRGQGIDDPASTTRFGWTPKGFHALVLSAEGSVSIASYTNDDTINYMTYYVQDLPREAAIFDCAFSEELNNLPTHFDPNFVSGATLRTYRLALALTGEYTQAYGGGTVSGGMTAAATAVNIFDAVFEKEVAIRLILIANEASIIFTDPATDGYTHGDRSTLVNENQTKLDSSIGAANYDIGHVFDGMTGGSGSGWAGVGFFGVCVGGVKAKGAIIFTNQQPGSPTTAHGMAHEMGHQFGARHTFNGTTDTCNGNRDALGAYEPGSGSTIMSYGGICGNESLPSQDTYYHTASLQQIINWSTTGSGGPCAGQNVTGNSPPAVNAGADFTIPKGTPFKLSATGSDADGEMLTYCWEELDLAPVQAPPNDDSDGQARPIFRSYPPVISPSRMFPRLQYILNNANVPPTTPFAGEVLPAITRTMNFQVTARDNRAGGGGVRTDLMQLNVRGDSGPFLVTQPNTAVTWTGSTMQTVMWSVNNTNLAPVNCANVRISLSTDGGNTFPIVLAAGTPNDGSEGVTVPNDVATTQARIKVEAVGNVFFDISNANFTVTPGGSCPVVSSISQSIGNVGTSVLITGGNFTGVSAVNFANNVAAAFTVNSNTQITTTVPSGAVTGAITISKTGCSDVVTGSFTVTGSPPSDLSTDNNPGGFGCIAIGGPGTLAHYVNRLTPASYPATLTSVSIYFPNCGLTVGTNLEVIVGLNTDGDTNINNTSFQATPVTVNAINQFNTYPVPNVTTNSGDFIVGFRITTASGVFPAPYDSTNPHNHRSYVSFNGLSFDLLDNVLPTLPGNFGIRARVYSGTASCPTITGISPTAGPPGTVVTITGTNLLGVTQVKFSPNVTVSFNVDSDAQITTMAPVGVTTGPITISKTGCADVQTGIFTSGVKASFDFDGDVKTDTSVWRPSTGVWFINNSSNGSTSNTGWGVNGDQIVPGDYDGDGKADIAVWRPSTGVWFIRNSSNGSTTSMGWGVSTDIPVPGDYDGDGKTDIAVWRPSSGTWFIINSSNGTSSTVVWGTNGDLPVPGNYDGDSKTDIAVWRPSSGTWFIIKSSNGQTQIVGWGVSGDKVVPGDYDGDGKTDIAIWRPSTGVWSVLKSSDGSTSFTGWGTSTDVAVPGDYDGDGKTDIAVWRPSSGTWFIVKSSDGSTSMVVWGVNGDIPVPSAFVRP